MKNFNSFSIIPNIEHTVCCSIYFSAINTRFATQLVKLVWFQFNKFQFFPNSFYHTV